jgi:hypothetical protein
LLISNATSFLLSESETSSASLSPPFDTSESDIAPRAVPTFETVANPDRPLSGGSTELWPWLAGAALVLLGLEWLVFARRG